ncbi:unnamed protein product [Rotaria sp. Silwood2]|nr:unnamed protein product [Rotaria sp. Silwood2]
MLPMSMRIAPIGFLVKLSNSTKATPNIPLNTIATSSQFATTQQKIFNLLDHITNQQITVAQTKISHGIEPYSYTSPISKFYLDYPTINSRMRLIINKLLNTGFCA